MDANLEYLGANCAHGSLRGRPPPEPAFVSSKLLDHRESRGGGVTVVTGRAPAGHRAEADHEDLEIACCCDPGRVEISYRGALGEWDQRMIGGRHYRPLVQYARTDLAKVFCV